MSRACSSNGEKRNACEIVVGKPKGQRQLGIPTYGWVGGCVIFKWILER
jgi:hypothetical protein